MREKIYLWSGSYGYNPRLVRAVKIYWWRKLLSNSVYSRYSRTYATHATQATHEPHATKTPQTPQPTIIHIYGYI